MIFVLVDPKNTDMERTHQHFKYVLLNYTHSSRVEPHLGRMRQDTLQWTTPTALDLRLSCLARTEQM